MSEIRDIVGAYCPMGCGQTLHLSAGGMIVCLAPDCPDQMAVAKLLGEPETDHIVTLRDDAKTWVFNEETQQSEQVSLGALYGTFTIRHPLRERIELEDLAHCPLIVRTSRNHPGEAGTYRVRPTSWVHDADPDPQDPLSVLDPKRGDIVHDWTWERIEP